MSAADHATATRRRHRDAELARPSRAALLPFDPLLLLAALGL